MMAPSTMILFKLGLVNLINLIMRGERREGGGGRKRGVFKTHIVYIQPRECSVLLTAFRSFQVN